MERCGIKFSGLGRLLSDCASEARYSNWTNQSNPNSAELFCPQPRRSFNSRSQNFDSFGSNDFDLDIRDIILTDDSEEEDSETDFFYCESPPLRSNNPLVNDPEFRYMGDFYVSVKSSSSVQRPSRSFSPSFISSPKLRVEGFSCGSSCGNSKSGQFLSALA